MKKLLAATLISLPLLATSATAADDFTNESLVQEALQEMGTVQNPRSPTATGGNFKYSTNPRIRAEQDAIFAQLMKYQTGLNTGDTSMILPLFADQSYSQWNESLTADTTQERAQQYNDLFKKEKFVTNFALDSIWVDESGDTAVARTHHHFGSVVTNFQDKESIIDLNREIFIMKKEDGVWKIYLYTYNTNPLQGVA